MCLLNTVYLSLERIADYMEIEQEAEPISKARPPAYWPASGDLRVENLSARYSMVCQQLVSFSCKDHSLMTFPGWTSCPPQSIISHPHRRANRDWYVPPLLLGVIMSVSDG